MADVDLIPWWGWVLLWLVLALAGAALLGVLAYRLVRQGLGVLTEAGAAGARAGQLMAQVESLPRARSAPAVLDDPAALLAQRRARQRTARRARARAVAARRHTTRANPVLAPAAAPRPSPEPAAPNR